MSVWLLIGFSKAVPVDILVAVPIAFVFNLFLDRFITGLTMGAVKG